jgi:phage gp46-like protein
MDFIIKFTTVNGRPVFSLSNELADITEDNILQTAVIISLFTDRLASDDDVIPDGGSDRRGWWGDILGQDNDNIGSLLWLLSREKQLESVRQRAEDYAYEALQWLLDDNVADALTVTATFPHDEWLGIHILIEKADGGLLNLDYSWGLFNGV